MFKSIGFSIALCFGGCAAVEAEAIIPDNASLNGQANYLPIKEVAETTCDAGYLSDIYKQRAKLLKTAQTLEDAINSSGTFKEKEPIEQRLESVEATLETLRQDIETCKK